MENKIFTKPFVRGVSVVVPKKIISIKNLHFDNTNMEDVIKVTGIHEIRQAADGETQTDYCISAAEHLINELNFDKSKIDGIIFATPWGEYITPGSAYLVQARMNFPNGCVLIDINQACAGFVHGLFQASMLIQSGYCKNVLVFAGDTPTLGMNKKDKSMRVIMGDAGSAAIVSAADSPVESAFSFYNDGKIFDALYTPGGGRKIPFKAGVTDVETADEQGNIRTLKDTHMDGLEVMAFAMTAAPKTIKNLLNTMNWSKEDVDLFALHQANEVILKALTKRLKVPAEKIPVRLKNYGNTAGTSIPLLLSLCAENHKPVGSWEKIIMCAFGNGLACAAAALSLQETYFCDLHEF